ERILRLRDADTVRAARLARTDGERTRDVDVGNRGELDRQVVARRALVTDGPRDDAEGARLDVELHRAGGADPHEGVRSDLDELFHGDRGGRTADAGGGHRDLLAVEVTRPRLVLAILGHELRLVEQACDGFAAAGVTGQEHVPAHFSWR